MPKSIIDKAYEHAVMRVKQDMSPFAGPDEIQKAPTE